MIVDFHCHSYYSDGSLTPQQLIQLAEQKGIELFAITDHDNCHAYNDLMQINTEIKIVSGIEFSTTWNKIGIHIVALNFDTQSEIIKQAVIKQSKFRKERAQKISQRLEKHGLDNAYEKIAQIKNGQQIGRPDFAHLLIKEGIVRDWNQAFKKYLGAGKPGDIKNQWLSFEEIVKIITSAGGVAILAHPLYYKLTNSKLRRLLQDFIKAGGKGLEVVNGFQNPDKTNYLIQLCKEYKLKASIGSDFHHPSKRKHLGCDTRLLKDSNVVWEDFKGI